MQPTPADTPHPTPPDIDEGLCIEATQRATGATVHEVANLITAYRNYLELAHDCFKRGDGRSAWMMVCSASQAEARLRIIVTEARRSAAVALLASVGLACA